MHHSPHQDLTLKLLDASAFYLRNESVAPICLHLAPPGSGSGQASTWHKPEYVKGAIERSRPLRLVSKVRQRRNDAAVNLSIR